MRLISLILLVTVGIVFIGCSSTDEAGKNAEKSTDRKQESVNSNSLSSTETTRTPADEIAALIQQLGSDDWETREKATARLIQIGEPAGPFLDTALDSADLEIRSRTRFIVKQTGLIPPSFKKKAEPLLEKLKSRDNKERCSALDEFLKILSPKSLKKILSVPPGKLEIAYANLPAKTCLPGTTIELKAKITNVDTTPFWVCKAETDYNNEYFDTGYLDYNEVREKQGPHIIPNSSEGRWGQCCQLKGKRKPIHKPIYYKELEIIGYYGGSKNETN